VCDECRHFHPFIDFERLLDDGIDGRSSGLRSLLGNPWTCSAPS
jgi:hypothetical protein